MKEQIITLKQYLLINSTEQTIKVQDKQGNELVLYLKGAIKEHKCNTIYVFRQIFLDSVSEKTEYQYIVIDSIDNDTILDTNYFEVY